MKKTPYELDLELIHLPEGYSTRGARLEDVEASLDLHNQWSRTVIGEDEITDAGAIRNEWLSPGFDPQRDIRLVIAPDGKLVGYVEAWTTFKPPVHPWIWGRVHPDYGGKGIGTYMLKWAEYRVKQVIDDLPPDLRFAPRVGIFSQATGSKKLFDDMGYRYIRSTYDMLIEMDAPPPAPAWPQGITLRTYDPETDAEMVYRADQDIFRDHFGFVSSPFDEGFARYKHFMIEYEGFDPSLWFLAMDGDELVGICLCKPTCLEDPDIAHVNDLGVRRPWRKRGLGLALLQHSFGEFYRRGKRKVNLGVDAENLTGALRLYEKAGMHVQRQFDIFEKELRPGREISVQSLGD
ncbi:MAG: GNAT family N-acetyltransferase [Chloroflexota bacterium]